MEHALTTRVKGSIQSVEEKITLSLKENGFGILTRIDVKETLKSKIDVDIQPYIILGACNPQLAHQALSHRPDLGVFLPCSVCLKEIDHEFVEVYALNPEFVLNQIDSEELVEHGLSARRLIERAIQSLTS